MQICNPPTQQTTHARISWPREQPYANDWPSLGTADRSNTLTSGTLPSKNNGNMAPPTRGANPKCLPSKHEEIVVLCMVHSGHDTLHVILTITDAFPSAGVCETVPYTTFYRTQMNTKLAVGISREMLSLSACPPPSLSRTRHRFDLGS